MDPVLIAVIGGIVGGLTGGLVAYLMDRRKYRRLQENLYRDLVLREAEAVLEQKKASMDDPLIIFNPFPITYLIPCIKEVMPKNDPFYTRKFSMILQAFDAIQKGIYPYN